jgi:type I restriction enzyme M protein
LNCKDIEKFSKVVSKDEIVMNNYNISPSRYIHTADAEEHRPISEIIEELNELEDEAKAVDKGLKEILRKIGY